MTLLLLLPIKKKETFVYLSIFLVCIILKTWSYYSLKFVTLIVIIVYLVGVNNRT